MGKTEPECAMALAPIASLIWVFCIHGQQCHFADGQTPYPTVYFQVKSHVNLF